MFRFLKPKTPCPKSHQPHPDWFRTRMCELRNLEDTYVTDYYNGWMTDTHLESKLDELQQELDSAIRQLKEGNKMAARIQNLEAELPFC